MMDGVFDLVCELNLEFIDKMSDELILSRECDANEDLEISPQYRFLPRVPDGMKFLKRDAP
jgi:hypothetical protein